MRIYDRIIIATIPACCTLVAIVYWPGLSGPFLLDDLPNILPSRIESFNLPDIITAMLSNSSGPLGRPVAALSFAINTATSGMDPWIFKASNLALHLITGLLAVWFLALLLKRSRSLPSNVDWQWALAVGLIWMLHPLQVSTVLYTVQRMTELSAIFTLAALISYLKARNLLTKKPKLALTILWLAIPSLTILACLSKENGILTAPAILITELFATTNRHHRRPLPIKVFLTLTCIIPLLIASTYFVFAYLPDLASRYANRPFSIEERLLTQPHALSFYLRMILIPDPRLMSLYHDDFPITKHLDIETILHIALHASAITAAIRLSHRAPNIAFGILWFYCWHTLESTVLPLEMVFEHRNYLASLGIVLAATDAAISITRPAMPGILKLTATGILLALLGFQTYNRTSVWGDEVLFTHMTADLQMRSHRANVQLTNILLRESNINGARANILRLTEITPLEAGPWLQLLYTHCLDNSAFPLSVIERAIPLATAGPVSPFTIESMKTLQDAYLSDNCATAPLAMLIKLTQLLTENKKNAYPFQSHFLLARYLANDNQVDMAIKHFRIACNTSLPIPLRAQTLAQLALLQIQNNLFTDAYDTITEIRQLSKNSLIDTNGLAIVLELELAHNLDQNGLIKQQP